MGCAVIGDLSRHIAAETRAEDERLDIERARDAYIADGVDWDDAAGRNEKTRQLSAMALAAAYAGDVRAAKDLAGQLLDEAAGDYYRCEMEKAA
ncbi:hypothetical protein [Chromobacterium haemolyticum]|uniref:Uncharacterized protein n=1 Tax=Chromobacterium haemolyticum TaxID=394935 RepID=A0A1W0D5L5_9NEIS|nr:hypothetical protein [Chromobacterium haemolyticum]OQS42299.1 hypothetical protein B0T45_05770 [Chromobacterium haemolyticum]